MTDNPDRLVTHAMQVERSIATVAAPILAMVAEGEAIRRAGWESGGRLGAEDLQAVVGRDRIAREIVGAIVAAGLRDVFIDAGFVIPDHFESVTDLAARWQRRVEAGALVPRRRR
jgi:hypothetical protein